MTVTANRELQEARDRIEALEAQVKELEEEQQLADSLLESQEKRIDTLEDQKTALIMGQSIYNRVMRRHGIEIDWDDEIEQLNPSQTPFVEHLAKKVETEIRAWETD